MRTFVNTEDYRREASRRLPRIAFDYLDPGAEDEITCRMNREQLAAIQFQPRVLRGTSLGEIDLSVETFGKASRLPLVIGPTGFAGLFWPNADLGLADCAAAAGIPFVLSTASTMSIEDVARRSNPAGSRWFQLYLLKDQAATAAMLQRAWDADYEAIVLTVDTPCAGKREASIRGGARLPLHLDARKILDFARHPLWTIQMLLNGEPHLANFPYSRKTPFIMEEHLKRGIGWDDMAWLRKNWDRPLIVKGIQCVEDALLARDMGADAIVVSNHGGRQLDGAQSPMRILAEIVRAVGSTVKVMIDSGFRRGSEAVKALAMGAHCVWLGRATLYGIAARGPAGAADVLKIFEDEMRRAMTLLGANKIKELDGSLIKGA
ncbi:alpha-hydroxy acid oxidase [Bordetella tumbae]|uniref:alpha-hydroxy acid oxidase n=1 Tax=Bordetella tumbae TaxID=1649139 RepID=UPI0039EF6276